MLETLGEGIRKEATPEQIAEREAARKALAEKMAAKRAEKLAEWNEKWDKARPVTLAEKDKAWIAGKGITKPWAVPHEYLESRGLTVPDDTTFRWLEKHHYGKRGNRYTGTVRPGSMLAQIIDARTGEVIGYHETFIDERTAKKFNIDIGGGNWVCRLTQVGFKGGIIKLCDADPGVDVVGVGEGIESALSIRELPEGKGAAIFAAVNVYNFDELPVPKNHKRVLVAIDIEPSGVGSRKAKEYAYRCACHDFGGKEQKDVQLIIPTIPGFQGKADLNDVIQGHNGFRNGEHYKLEKIVGAYAKEPLPGGGGNGGNGSLPPPPPPPNDDPPPSSDDEVVPRPPQYSDIELAHRFAARYGHHVRYVKAWGKWFLFNGKVWKEDQTQRVQLFASRICARAAAEVLAEEPTKGRKLAHEIASSRTIASLLKVAQTLPLIAATSDQWDTDLWLLNTPGGSVDLRTGKMRPHNPDDYCTKMTQVTPGGECPMFLKFLDEVTADDKEMVDYLQRKNGYILTGVTTEHAVFFTYGDGRNGKSVYQGTIGYVMGDYDVVAPISTFIVTNNEQHPTDLADLRGARYVRCSEVAKGQRWAEEKVKMLSGGDPVKARFMRQDFFTFMPQCKLEFIGNVRPRLRTVGKAAEARFHMTPFTVFIPPEKRDKDLMEKLQAEGPGILQWMIDGCLKWQAEGLKPPPAVIAASEEYMRTQDVTAAWMEECCVVGSQYSAVISVLFRSWKAWAMEAGEWIGTRSDLKERLVAKGFQAGKTEHGITIFGLRPGNPADPPQAGPQNGPQKNEAAGMPF